MMRTLLESRRLPTRGAGRVVMSVVLHAGLVMSLVLAAAEASPAPEPSVPETITFHRTPPQRAVPRTDPVVAPSLAPRAPAVSFAVAPVLVPSVLPAVDLQAVTQATVQFALNVGDRSVTDFGVEAPTGAPAGNVYLEHQVDRPVGVRGRMLPAYPDPLRRAGVEGDVLVSFVVDTLGRADMTTFTVIRATHDLFTRAVRDAVTAQRFTPAETGGRRVRQLVQQPFSFAIQR